MASTSESAVDKWSNETVLQFLDYSREEPIIWHAAHPKHKIRNDVYDAWKRIEVLMDNKLTVNELKKKKESLMASFRACLTKVKSSKRSGAGTDEVYKPIWFAYDKMASFLINKDEPRQTINTEDILSQIDNELQNEIRVTENLDNQEPPEINLQLDNEGIILSVPRETDGSVMPPKTRNVVSHIKKKPKRVETDEIKKKMDDAYSLLTKPPKEKDLCDIYGELVAAKLKALDEQSRQIAMHRMDNILFEIKMNTTINKPVLLHSTSALSPGSMYSTSSCSISTTPLASPPPSQSNEYEENQMTLSIPLSSHGETDNSQLQQYYMKL